MPNDDSLDLTALLQFFMFAHSLGKKVLGCTRLFPNLFILLMCMVGCVCQGIRISGMGPLKGLLEISKAQPQVCLAVSPCCGGAATSWPFLCFSFVCVSIHVFLAFIISFLGWYSLFQTLVCASCLCCFRGGIVGALLRMKAVSTLSHILVLLFVFCVVSDCYVCWMFVWFQR